MKGKVEVELNEKTYQLEYSLYSDGDFFLTGGRNGTGKQLDVFGLTFLQSKHYAEILSAIHKNEMEKRYAENI
jgi:hypothetical protein